MSDALDLGPIKAREKAATKGPWDEEWRPISSAPGYEVSDQGNVRSYFKKGNHRDKRSGHPRTLAVRTGLRAYPSVSLPTANGKYRNRLVHRLVMEAFEGSCPDGMEVAHINGNKDDCRRVNLEYVTHLENERHKISHGTKGVGEKNSNANLLGWQVAEIKYLASKSVPQGRIADLFRISHKDVSAILSGRAWAEEVARTDIPALITEVESLRSRLAAANEAKVKAERERDAYLDLLIDNDMGESCLVWLNRHTIDLYGTERFPDRASALAAIRKAAGLESST